MKIKTISSDFDTVRFEFNKDESICKIEIPVYLGWLSDDRFASGIAAMENEDLFCNHICGDTENLRKIGRRLRSFFLKFVEGNSPDVNTKTDNEFDYKKLAKSIEAAANSMLDLCSVLKDAASEIKKLGNQ